MTNKDLLQSSGSATQYFVITYNGKAAEKESRVEYHEIRKNIENQRMNAIKYERNQMEAIRIIVETDSKNEIWNIAFKEIIKI